MKENLKSKNEKYKILCIKSLDEIHQIIKMFDTDFEPSLSEILNLNNYADKLLQNAVVYTIKENDIFLGFTAFYANDSETHVAYLAQIAVKLEARNRKIGKILLDSCIETSKRHGMNKLKLEVNNCNTVAIKFYEDNSFNFCGNASANSKYMIKNI